MCLNSVAPTRLEIFLRDSLLFDCLLQSPSQHKHIQLMNMMQPIRQPYPPPPKKTSISTLLVFDKRLWEKKKRQTFCSFVTCSLFKWKEFRFITFWKMHENPKMHNLKMVIKHHKTESHFSWFRMRCKLKMAVGFVRVHSKASLFTESISLEMIIFLLG